MNVLGILIDYCILGIILSYCIIRFVRKLGDRLGD